VDTWKGIGHPLTTDPRSGKASGGASIPSYIDPATVTRSYAATGYYAPNKDRPNLAVICEALAEKIEFESEANVVRATGVAFTAGGKTLTVKTKREVLLCAGAIKSPQILELSGIGSPDLLQKFGIKPLAANEGVGENVRDHPAIGLGYELVDGEVSLVGRTTLLYYIES
jgi:choline dehydrogenase-like flavoprotein